jgi:hypothetical protein
MVVLHIKPISYIHIDDNNKGLVRNHHKAIKLLKRSGIYAIFTAYLHEMIPSINNTQTYHEKKSNINIVESLE